LPGLLWRIGGAAPMQIHLLKSKIHQANVTDASPDYEGSLSIPSDLMAEAGLVPYERILVGNIANGQRFETYAIPGDPGGGRFVLNGATAHRGRPGDRLTIMSFAWVESPRADGWKPRVIVLDQANRIVNRRGL
jgi:aspartate 1-decarboxylase